MSVFLWFFVLFSCHVLSLNDPMIFKPRLYTFGFGNYTSISKFSHDLVSHFQISARHSHLNALMISHTHRAYNCSYPTKSLPAHEYLVVSKCSVKDHNATASPLACYLFSIMWPPPWLTVYDLSFDKYKNLLTGFLTLRLRLLTTSHFRSFLPGGVTLHCSLDKSSPFIWRQVALYPGPRLLLFNNV